MNVSRVKEIHFIYTTSENRILSWKVSENLIFFESKLANCKGSHVMIYVFS